MSKGQELSRFLRRLKRNDQPPVDDRVHETSADLAYELQSKMFDQLGTVGVAGAGLAVTLIGSTLRHASGIDWLAVVLFSLAAVTSIKGNQKLVDSLNRRQPGLERSKRDLQTAQLLVGMAIGSLAMSVYSDGVGRNTAVTGGPAPAAQNGSQ